MEPYTTLAPISIHKGHMYVLVKLYILISKMLKNDPFFLVGVNFQKKIRIQDFSFLNFRCIFEKFHNFNI
jgi:hypothetical protein